MAVYLVKRVGAPDDEKPRVIEARMKATAIGHVAQTSFTAETISTKQAFELSASGVELESAEK